ncbi:MAG: trypsin-like peptidase domain-containing protein [candidate division NC10 bacterium]|nr:trypsin-like peptidase domain-containing protein [candidate division NC10 bacterium]
MRIGRVPVIVCCILLLAAGPATAPLPAAGQEAPPLTLTLPAAPGQPDPELGRISQRLVRLAESLRPALVQVRARGRAPAAPPDGGEAPDGRGPRRGLGSGFIVSSEGHVLTNHHVVRGAQSVEVRLHDGKRLAARVLGSDARTDLAVLKIDGVSDLPVMRLGDSEALQVGELVMALGNPFGLEQSVTLGIVSRKPVQSGAAGPGFQFIQTDAEVNPGNSGGPLVNMAGEVVGVNSAATSRGSIGFAIPSRVVQAVAPVLAARGKMTWGWLGVTISDLEEEPTAAAPGAPLEGGALVREVRPDEPAARGGVKPGDVVVEVDGKPVREPRDLQQIVAGLPPGRTVPVAVRRDGRRETLTVQIGEAPDPTP